MKALYFHLSPKQIPLSHTNKFHNEIFLLVTVPRVWPWKVGSLFTLPEWPGSPWATFPCFNSSHLSNKNNSQHSPVVCRSVGLQGCVCSGCHRLRIFFIENKCYHSASALPISRTKASWPKGYSINDNYFSILRDCSCCWMLKGHSKDLSYLGEKSFCVQIISISVFQDCISKGFINSLEQLKMCC